MELNLGRFLPQSADQAASTIGRIGGSSTARVLAAANAVSGGALAGLVLSSPVGAAVTNAGYKYAALGGQIVKGVLAWFDMNGKPQSFAFPINPDSLEETLSPEWATHKAPGQNRPTYHFVHGGERELTFTLHFFYDSPDRRVIRDQLDALRGLTQRPYAHIKQGGGDGPPPVYLYFGEYIRGERFIVKGLKIKVFDLFDPALLLPLRAEVEVSLLEALDPFLVDGNDPRKNLRVQQRGSIDSVIRTIGNAF